MSLIVTLASQSIDQKVVETAHVSVRYGHVNFKMAPRARVRGGGLRNRYIALCWSTPSTAPR